MFPDIGKYVESTKLHLFLPWVTLCLGALLHMQMLWLNPVLCSSLLSDRQANSYRIWWSWVYLWRIFYVCTCPPDQCKYVPVGSFFLPCTSCLPPIFVSITLTLHPTCVSCRAAAAVSGGTLSANESQVWATVNGVSKRVRITFWECETWKKEDKLWSDVMSYFWVDCSSKEKGSFKEKLMYVSEQREEKQDLFRTPSLE